MKFIRKTDPVIEAMQVPASGDYDLDDFVDWAEERGMVYLSGRNESIEVKNQLGHWIVAYPGDYIMHNRLMGFTVCPKKDFEYYYTPR